MTLRNLGIVSLFAFAAAACSQKPADDSNITIDETVNAADVANADIETVPADDAPGNVTTPDKANAPVHEGDENAVIPAALQGRWGMNVNDCNPKMADVAKGLIVIDAASLKFYESRAKLTTAQTVEPNKLVAKFAFSGEGMTWEKVETLARSGDTLTRKDDEGSYTYKRCA